MSPAAAAEDRAGLALRVRRGLEEIAVPFPSEAPAALARLATLVASWGSRINLSGHRSPKQICDRLILDAAALSSTLPEFDSLADLGSGAGFPGLPISILYPDRQVILVEARRRRHYFQRAAIRELGIDAECLLGRIEQLEPVECHVALAQAVAPAEDAAALARPWARVGGWIAIPASSQSPVPAFGAPAPGPVSGLGPASSVRCVDYQVPGGPSRKLWLLQQAPRD